MSTSTQPADEQSQIHSEIFAQMVMQQASLAMMFLGVRPHPQTGKTIFDLDAAQTFIAQLDMLEAKTSGNLSPDEAALLKQSLTTVRMAFVQAVNSGDPSQEAAASEAAGAAPAASEPAPQSAPAAEATPGPGSSSADDERKKFVKKY